MGNGPAQKNIHAFWYLVRGAVDADLKDADQHDHAADQDDSAAMEETRRYSEEKSQEEGLVAPAAEDVLVDADQAVDSTEALSLRRCSRQICYESHSLQTVLCGCCGLS